MSQSPATPPTTPTRCWHIQPVTHATTPQVVRFIKEARREMFPQLCAQRDDEVARWIQSGCFLLATEPSEPKDDDGEGEKEVIATIGFVPYHHRFTHFPPYADARRTVEVVRLFVLPPFRRCGLASALVGALKRRAVQDGVARLYLHTHPFLPGAIAFWEKHGFGITCVEEEDGVWRTTHMDMLVGEDGCA
ncbi:acyl-CoA N-acyltransferase [Bipolaris maydis]|nr:acyl-CoA N-acyltransferase [Bipolaris maydis]